MTRRARVDLVAVSADPLVDPLVDPRRLVEAVPVLEAGVVVG